MSTFKTLAAVVAMTLTTTLHAEAPLQAVTTTSSTTSASAINILRNGYYDLYGRIGGDNYAELHYHGGTGYYTFIGYTRIVRWGSYNRNTGQLILKGYDENNGKYIGQFVGKVIAGRYKGTFTNYKGGKVTFDLVFAGD